MSHAEFVHLRVHTAYSLSEGAITIGALTGLCRDERMPAVAITDTGNMFGALEFSEAAAKAGIQPIIGCQLWLARPDQPDPGAAGLGAHAPSAPPDKIVLLAQNEAGYRNLMQLSSAGYLAGDGGLPAVPLDVVERYADGLIALTGGPAGTVGRLLAEGQEDAAARVLDRLEAAFAGRLYVELMRHDLAEERAIEAALIDLAYDRELPLVATNDCYFAAEEMYEAHDALLCIASGRKVAEDNRRQLTPHHRFRGAAEMRALFADLPEAVENTLAIARRCAYRPLPHAPMLPSIEIDGGKTEEQALRDAAESGLAERLERQVFTADMDDAAREEAARPYHDRLEFELGVIIKMGFPGYFLIVAEFIGWAKEQGIPVGPGRGSGAGSVAAWALKITDLDPLRFGLLFERFLNPERVSMPDFDIDFCQERRDEVIEHVRGLYGAERVAQIITFGTLQARAALRDVGRVLSMPYGQVDRISKLVPFNPANPPKLADAIAGEPQLQAMREEDETVAKLLDIALKLEGLFRHASTHAAGVVIAPRPLPEVIPVYRDARTELVATQFSMKYTEMAGLVKFDFLGLKTLTVLQKALALIGERPGEAAPNLADIPLDDPAAYGVMSRAETVGVFQLESAGMRDALRQLKPDSFEDVIALVALYRPGPMDNIPRYIACKHGRERPDYLHPELEGILRETFGVIIYQEQVMQIAQVLSGFSLAKADLLRRAMGKKIKAEMEAQRETFVEGAMARGVPKSQAAHIFDLVDKFAGYGFNKSHAAAYALIAYQTAWLKANYPVEFMAALMTLDLGNTDKLTVYKQELDRMGIQLLPPDINRSGVEFAVEPLADGTRAIRYALAAIKNVGSKAMAELVAARDAEGTFADIADFANRIDAKSINRRQLENLIRAGALDGLNPNRRQMFDALDSVLHAAHAAADARESGQGSLFAEAGADVPPPEIVLSPGPDWGNIEKLGYEFESIGFYLSAHPLDDYAVSLARLGVKPYGDLAARFGGDGGGQGKVKLAGLVVRKQERTSARGNRFAFLQLTDSSGVFEVTMFSELLTAAGETLVPGAMVLLHAEARAEGDGLRLTALALEPLDQAAARAAAGLRVRLRTPDPLAALRTELSGIAEGRGRVSLVLGTGAGEEVELCLPGRYVVTPDVRARIEALDGVEQAVEL